MTVTVLTALRMIMAMILAAMLLVAVEAVAALLYAPVLDWTMVVVVGASQQVVDRCCRRCDQGCLL
jgi:hypothetical protein